MASYAQISLITIPCKREDGSVRHFEFRLQERDSAGADLPFDLEGPVELQHGAQNDDILKPLKPSQVTFRIKTKSGLADKLIDAGTRQFLLTIRETQQNYTLFTGYIQPNFHEYGIYEAVQTVQLKATGELAALDVNNADNDLKRLADIFSQSEAELELNRPVDYYMQTRYDGQSISDPIPQRIWMRELGKLGAEKGHRLAAIQQIAQEFNFQIFQRDGRLVVADVYERFRNPEAVNLYFGGTTQTSVDVLVTLDQTNVIRKVADDERRPTGQKSPRVGRVVMQRKYPNRFEVDFPPVLTNQPVDPILTTDLPGIVAGGDIIYIRNISGTIRINEGNDSTGAILEAVAIRFLSSVTGESYYYDFASRQWSSDEVYAEQTYQSLPQGIDTPWKLSEIELSPIPESDFGEIQIQIHKRVESTLLPAPGADISNLCTMIAGVVQANVRHNDRPDDLYHQIIKTNSPGNTSVFPYSEADYDIYSGDEGAMHVGVSSEDITAAQGIWIDEETDERIAFGDLSARRKAKLLLGSSDRIHLVIRDTTQVSLLSVISFEGKLYAPVAITEHLFQGYTEIWMKPAPFLDYDSQEGYTYTPEDLPASASSGTSRGWVTNRIIDSMNSNLAAGAIARTTANLQGLVEVIAIDRENLLFEGDTIDIINPFNLDRVTFTVIADQEGTIITTAPENVLSMMPAGSYVYSSIDGLAAGVRQSRYATQIYSQLFGVGVLRETVNAVRSSLPVHLFVKIRGGTTLNMTNEQTGVVYTIPVGGDNETWYQGSVDLPIQSQLISAPEGSRIQLGNSFISAILQVDPGGVYANVTRRLTGDAIGTLSADRSGTITTLPLQDIDADTELQGGQELRLINREGRNEKVIVSGDQTVTAPADSITIQSVELEHEYVAGHAYVKEPSYSMTGKLTIQAGYTELLQTATNDQATAIAGLELDVTDLESASATLFANVNNLEDDLDTETDARLQLQADLNSAQSSLTTTISRVNNNEDDIDDLILAQAGLIQLVGNVESQVDGLDDDLGDLETVIGRIDARQIMYVQSNGNIAYVDMTSGQTGSNINISADYISINDIIFDDSAGTIRSSNYNSSNGWILRRNGDAEFNNVYVRGTILEMNLSGSILLPGGVGALSSSGLVLSGNQEVSFGPASSGIGGGMSWDGGILIDSTQAVRIESGTIAGISLRPGLAGNLTLDLSGGSHQGELRFRLNTNNGMNITGLVTTKPGGSGNIYSARVGDLGSNDRVLGIVG